MVTFVNYQQLADDVAAMSTQLPRTLVGVIGIPRSGMLVGNMLALHRNLPLVDLYSFARTGTFINGGHRLQTPLPDTGEVVVIDDSVSSGRSMDAATRLLQTQHASQRFTLIYATLYCRPRATNRVDVFLRTIKGPRYFQWNLMHHCELSNMMVDLDGVLCCDPPPETSATGAYEDYLADAVPLHLPTVPVHSISTNRLEKYRDISVHWLRKYHVEHKALYMSPHVTPEARRRAEPYGLRKGREYAASPCHLFIESSAEQAQRIATVSRKPVICLEDFSLYSPDTRLQSLM